uniref:Uncharacterized protein n=1 Tax=Lepeophtheirus salmonis TaxID=72036 RepID=A0A0K2U8F3_LEPSM
MGASLGEVDGFTRNTMLKNKILKKKLTKYLVSLLDRKLFRPPSYEVTSFVLVLIYLVQSSLVFGMFLIIFPSNSLCFIKPK